VGLSTAMQAQDASDALALELDDLQREIDGIELENQVFTEYLEKIEREAAAETPQGRTGAANSRVRTRLKLPQTLTPVQKVEVANAMLDAKHKETDESKKGGERLVDTLRAVLEETDLRISELKKDAYEFKRDIVVGAENMRTGKTMAEKVQKYMEDKLKNRDSMVDKLKLKNVTIKAQIQKLESQLRQKEEMGDVLHYIDFHQLQIENKQYVAKIDERNEELLRLKLATGSTVQSLNSLKENLTELTKEEAFLEKEIKSRNDMLRKVRDEASAVGTDITADQRQRKRFSQQQSEHSEMPQILDYVAQKKEYYELQTALKNWQRKLEIMEMAAKKAKALKRMARTQQVNFGT